MESNKILSQGRSKQRHLPKELCREILSRLPSKSLVRFCCVSKSWLSMIKDPDFRRLHLKNFKNNRDETHLILVQGMERSCILYCSDNNSETDGESLHSLGQKDGQGRWRVECSIDGLVLLKSCYSEFNNKLMLWNPSIKKFHEIPCLPEFEPSPNTCLFKDAEVGLGYDHLAKDYKHVKLIFVDCATLHSVAVYTLGTGSWNIIPIQAKDWQWGLFADMKAVYLRGSLYFIGFNVNKEVLELLSFDLSSEVFSCTSLPRGGVVEDKNLSGPLTLVDNGCKLGMFDFEGEGMWVLESSGWTIRYSFGIVVHKFLYHKKNGEILIRWDNHEMFFKLATSEELVQRWNMVSSYNLETRKQKILLQTKYLSFKVYNVLGYVESLFLLK